jgi:hypothetical protein
MKLKFRNKIKFNMSLPIILKYMFYTHTHTSPKEHTKQHIMSPCTSSHSMLNADRIIMYSCIGGVEDPTGSN